MAVMACQTSASLCLSIDTRIAAINIATFIMTISSLNADIIAHPFMEMGATRRYTAKHSDWIEWR